MSTHTPTYKPEKVMQRKMNAFIELAGLNHSSDVYINDVRYLLVIHIPVTPSPGYIKVFFSTGIVWSANLSTKDPHKVVPTSVRQSDYAFNQLKDLIEFPNVNIRGNANGSQIITGNNNKI